MLFNLPKEHSRVDKGTEETYGDESGVKLGFECRKSPSERLKSSCFNFSAMQPIDYDAIIIGTGCCHDTQDPRHKRGSLAEGTQPDHLLEFRRWYI